MKIISILPDHNGTRFYTEIAISAALASEIRKKVPNCSISFGPHDDESGDYVYVSHDDSFDEDEVKSKLEAINLN